ncbi:MAG: SDR family oxidoreductase [Phycisphaerae bacterium]
MDVSGKVVMITGASRGLGRSLVERFASAGAAVAFCSRHYADLTEIESRCATFGAGALALQCDVRFESDVIRTVHRTFDRFRRIDVVINAAAIRGPRLHISAHPLEPWHEVLQTNLTGTYLVCREVVPYMQRLGRGLIINVTDTAAGPARSSWGAYSASKSGVEGLSRTLADELLPRGIRVVTIDPELPPELSSPTYEHCLDAFLWLASDESASLSGQHLRASEFRHLRRARVVH